MLPVHEDDQKSLERPTAATTGRAVLLAMSPIGADWHPVRDPICAAAVYAELVTTESSPSDRLTADLLMYQASSKPSPSTRVWHIRNPARELIYSRWCTSTGVEQDALRDRLLSPSLRPPRISPLPATTSPHPLSLHLTQEEYEARLERVRTLPKVVSGARNEWAFRIWVAGLLVSTAVAGVSMWAFATSSEGVVNPLGFMLGSIALIGFGVCGALFRHWKDSNLHNTLSKMLAEFNKLDESRHLEWRFGSRLVEMQLTEGAEGDPSIFDALSVPVIIVIGPDPWLRSSSVYSPPPTRRSSSNSNSPASSRAATPVPGSRSEVSIDMGTTPSLPASAWFANGYHTLPRYDSNDSLPTYVSYKDSQLNRYARASRENLSTTR
ncbi:hypothetical protein BJ742DRAFT_318195 [Cladochytrium replicatum]|nr:hypothetical protein BJ742DRAFT_318195 [Cladochytrium replicatum]